ncbi:hypothetical protein D3C72_1659920 [compost metagenome]
MRQAQEVKRHESVECTGRNRKTAVQSETARRYIGGDETADKSEQVEEVDAANPASSQQGCQLDDQVISAVGAWEIEEV